MMLDMYRQPDKLLALIDKLLPTTIDTALALAEMSHNPRVFMAINRGADGLMSLQQFEKFYWPGFKQVVLAVVDAGLTPVIHFQGCFDTRLEYFTEFPRGKVIGLFDRTDIFRAKEIVGDTMCIAGNMPLTLLRAGTPEEIKDYARRLINIVGKDGGFIMSSNTVLDDADPERVRIWMDFTREYGVYR
jgi:uroporphyrinogen-III decarboxylase